MKRTRASIVLGVFLGCVMLGVAARYEDFTVGKIRATHSAQFDSTVSVAGVLTASGGVAGNVTGNVAGTVTGPVTTSGFITLTPTSASVTNGQAYTPVASATILTGIGGETDSTNTITLANPGTIGRVVALVVATGSTNHIGLADSGNLKLSAAFAGNADDSIVLYSTATNVWTELSRSAN
jgi:hypothetical protein